MKRRSALFVMFAALAGCGGGGDSPAPSAAPTPSANPAPSASPAPTPAPTPVVILSNNIAAWGDSLTDATRAIPGYVAQLRPLFPARDVYDGGVWGQTSPQILSRIQGDAQHTTWINVFWMGRNNFRQPDQVKADIAAAVAHLEPSNKHFLVLSVINSPAEPKGSPEYATILQLNADLAAAYPDHYVDVRSEIVAAFDPTLPQDVTDHDNDVPPLSLRADGLHLNTAGTLIVAQRVKQFVVDGGW